MAKELCALTFDPPETTQIALLVPSDISQSEVLLYLTASPLVQPPLTNFSMVTIDRKPLKCLVCLEG